MCFTLLYAKCVIHDFRCIFQVLSGGVIIFTFFVTIFVIKVSVEIYSFQITFWSEKEKGYGIPPKQECRSLPWSVYFHLQYSLYAHTHTLLHPACTIKGALNPKLNSMRPKAHTELHWKINITMLDTPLYIYNEGRRGNLIKNLTSKSSSTHAKTTVHKIWTSNSEIQFWSPTIAFYPTLQGEGGYFANI